MGCAARITSAGLRDLRYSGNIITLKSRIVAQAPISENLRFLTFSDRKNGSDNGAGAVKCVAPLCETLG